MPTFEHDDLYQKPLAKIPKCLQSLLVFGCPEQIRALKDWRKKEDVLRDRASSAARGEMRCFEVERRFIATDTIYVMARDCLEAETISGELNVASGCIDLDHDESSAFEIDENSVPKYAKVIWPCKE